MRVRGATAFGQLGWMALGSVAGSCIALLIATIVVMSDFTASLGWVVALLLLVIPVSAVLALVPWVGYLLGGLIANRWQEEREAAALVYGGVMALALGGLAILAANLLTRYPLGIVNAVAVGGLIVSVAVVTLARLPLDRRYMSRYPPAAE